MYSDLAINKAFTTGTTYEDTLFVLYIKTSELVLKNACGLDFSRRYIVDFAPSLWSKEKKSKQLLHVIDNVLLKKYVEIKVSCTDYENNKEYIDSLIKEGFSFCIVIDDEFDGNISLLLLFSTIYIYENNEYFDIIINIFKIIVILAVLVYAVLRIRLEIKRYKRKKRRKRRRKM